jgi:hypothetical protein
MLSDLDLNSALYLTGMVLQNAQLVFPVRSMEPKSTGNPEPLGLRSPLLAELLTFQTQRYYSQWVQLVSFF